MTTIRKNKFISVCMTLILLLTVFVAVDSMEVYAASLKKPSVSASNASATSVKLSWKKVTGAKKYTVYRSTKKSSGYKAIKTTTSVSYTSKGLTCGKTYYFKVKAINGSKSKTSSVVTIKVKPAKVKSVSAQKGCTFLKVKWAKATGVSGYEVYSCSTKSGTYKKLVATSSTSYKNTGLKFSTKRYYKVRAYKTVSGKKIYGSFSSVIYGTTASSHNPSTSWTIKKAPTCNATGKRTNVCSYCGKTYSQTMPVNSDEHKYVKSTISNDAEYCDYTKYTCSVCGDVYTSSKKTHKLTAEVTAPSCTEKGYTTYTCSRSGCKYSRVADETPPAHNYVKVEVRATCTEPTRTAYQCTVCGEYDPDSEFIPSGDPLGHSYGEGYTLDENGYRIYTCTVCGDNSKCDRTCYIDLSNYTISVPAVAEFKVSSSSDSEVITKLDLNPDGVSNYEITGSAENLTIDVNAATNVEIKLNNASITNEAKDCFDIKNKSTEVDEAGEIILPEVSISIKDGTENNLITTSSGNAIESSCKLVLKGHGVLNIDTASTSITSKGKIDMKNATINITSKNRGIDTENKILNDAGLIVSEEYSNITIQPNTNLTINSTDDGIRCKNMEITALKEGDENSVIYIRSQAGDGIQLEGKKGITVNSGDLTIIAGKYAFNCKAERIFFADGVSNAKCRGVSGYSKP